MQPEHILYLFFGTTHGLPETSAVICMCEVGGFCREHSPGLLCGPPTASAMGCEWGLSLSHTHIVSLSPSLPSYFPLTFLSSFLSFSLSLSVILPLEENEKNSQFPSLQASREVQQLGHISGENMPFLYGSSQFFLLLLIPSLLAVLDQKCQDWRESDYRACEMVVFLLRLNIL